MRRLRHEHVRQRVALDDEGKVLVHLAGVPRLLTREVRCTNDTQRTRNTVAEAPRP